MHDSQNSISSKASFTSTVLAQAILLDIPIPSNEITILDIQTISNNIICKIDLFTQGQQIEFTVGVSKDTG